MGYGMKYTKGGFPFKTGGNQIPTDGEGNEVDINNSADHDNKTKELAKKHGFSGFGENKVKASDKGFNATSAHRFNLSEKKNDQDDLAAAIEEDSE
jgi:HD superfamily phosphodiesterase